MESREMEQICRVGNRDADVKNEHVDVAVRGKGECGTDRQQHARVHITMCDIETRGKLLRAEELSSALSDDLEGGVGVDGREGICAYV